MAPDANQSDADSLRDDADVIDMTERRRLELVEENMGAWERMCLQATQTLVESPSDLGDVRHVSPTGWSRARNHPEYNPLLKCLAMMAERRSEGATRQDILEFALVMPAFANSLFALDGEQVDVPEAIESACRRINEFEDSLVPNIMDGIYEPDEKANDIDKLRALEAAARTMRSALQQNPEQTELWQSEAMRPRV